MNIKKIVKEFVPPIVLKAFPRSAPLEQRYFGADNLDEKLKKYLNYDNGFFVELGANDGKTQSNTLYYEKHRGWRGVLIEPIPQNFLKCRKNRSPENYIVCNACTSFDYQEKFVEIIYSNLMSTAPGLESDLKDPMEHAKTGKQYLSETEDNFVFGALAKPLNEILIEARAPRQIDFLSLDVEGAEIEVLKGIDHNQFRFTYMCIESRGIEKIEHFLNEKGYEMIEKITFHDYIFKLKNS